MSEADAGGGLLHLADVGKTYPGGTVALQGVDLTVHPGRVHGLVGANGAGKSTLIKILGGVHEPSSGRMTWEGAEVSFTAPVDAQRAGLATLHQHVPLASTLTVLENVFLGRRGPWRRPAALRDELDELQRRVGSRLEPDALVSALSHGRRQIVGILQALGTGARAVVMDEPTASLANEERQLVFAAVRRLRDEGTAVLYVSHFLDEVLDLCDTITVLRDGRVIGEGPVAEWTEERLTLAIIGRELLAAERAVAAHTPAATSTLLEVRDLRSPGRVDGVSLDVRRGEVVGIAGLLGSGRSELLHAIFGADPRAEGDVVLDGRAVRRGTREAVDAGLALVPEDRMGQGLVADAPIWRNVSLPDLPALSRARMLPERDRELTRAREAIEKLGIRASGPEAIVGRLSGGNAQKVVFAKWLLSGARVLLLDEPTAGIDVGAKADILALLDRFAADGGAVLVVSSEFEELLAMTSRVLVLARGRIVAERRSADTTEQELLMLASGLKEPTL